QIVDGSVCNHSVDVSTLAGRTLAFRLLTGRGLIRIAMSVPAGAEFSVWSVTNPYGCNEVSPLSIYRRPLPTANLRFLSTLMWDGRESSALAGTRDISKATNPGDLLSDLAHQVVDAAFIHEEAAAAPSAAQQQAIVNFEMELFLAQAADSVAGSLQSEGAGGGPAGLGTQSFFIGINDPVGLNSSHIPF